MTLPSMLNICSMKVKKNWGSDIAEFLCTCVQCYIFTSLLCMRKTCWVIVQRIASEDSIDLRSAYVTRFSVRIIQGKFYHMFPTLHCNSLFNSGMT